MTPETDIPTIPCLIEKDGEQREVYVVATKFDEDRLQLHFPDSLYSGDGFTLLRVDGRCV